jgi:hypothetical protein
LRGPGAECGVKTLLVIEVLELPERVQEVALVPDERAVQELVSARLHPAFHDRIHSRQRDPAEHDFDTRVGSYCWRPSCVMAKAAVLPCVESHTRHDAEDPHRAKGRAKVGATAISDYPPSAIPWPIAVDWSAIELGDYLASAADPAIQRVPTRCAPWAIRDLTAHLAATFRRFAGQLDRANAGDLTEPFGPGDLSPKNLRAVELFRGDPLQALERQATRFLSEALRSQADQLMGHQRGPVPVGLQVIWA